MPLPLLPHSFSAKRGFLYRSFPSLSPTLCRRHTATCPHASASSASASSVVIVFRRGSRRSCWQRSPWKPSSHTQRPREEPRRFLTLRHALAVTTAGVARTRLVATLAEEAPETLALAVAAMRPTRNAYSLQRPCALQLDWYSHRTLQNSPWYLRVTERKSPLFVARAGLGVGAVAVETCRRAAGA